MTGSDLARSYLEKAEKRVRVLEVLLEQDGFSDVVREAQELVELALKAMLRQIGTDPPKWHAERAIRDARIVLDEARRLIRP